MGTAISTIPRRPHVRASTNVNQCNNGDVQESASGEFVGHQLTGKSSSSSTFSVECRICHQSERESGKKLGDAGCSCQGDIARVHSDCLQRWVDARHNAECEICSGTFAGLRPSDIEIIQRTQGPNPFPNINFQHVRPTLETPCTNTRRGWFLVIMVLLLLSVIICVILTMETNRGELTVSYDPNMMSPFVTRLRGNTTDTEFTQNLSGYMLSFCSLITVGVGALWMIAEVAVWPLEREVLALTAAQHMQNYELQMVLGGDNNS